jgi:uncharacterized membrane protein YeaQ/YmgE (transglycosylase-associated protein family)
MLYAILIVLALIGLFVILPMAGSLLNAAIVIGFWALVGWGAGKIMRGHGYGALGNIALGLGGGLVGGFLFGILAPGMGAGLFGGILSGVVGAIVLIFVVRALGIDKNFGR